DQRFAVRDQAFRELKKLQEVAEPTLHQALSGNPPLEMRRRVQLLLQGRHHGEVLVPPGEVLQHVRAMQVLEAIGTPEVRRWLERLAEGAPQAWIPRAARSALERLKGTTESTPPGYSENR